jgi:hypothetical protein
MKTTKYSKCFILILIFTTLFFPRLKAQSTHKLLTSVVITDTSNTTARPEIVVTSNRVFILYLSATNGYRTFRLKIYNNNMDSLIASQILVTPSVDYGAPTDIRIASDGQYLYAFYETVRTISPGKDSTYLWGAKYTLNDIFSKVSYTATPISRSKPVTQLSIGGEKLDDPAPLIGSSSIFVITRLHDSIRTTGSTIYRVREFDRNNLSQLSKFDLDLSDIADGRARVTSLLYWHNNILIALSTTVSNSAVNENSDDGAKSDIILVKMQPNWTYNPLLDVHTLTAEPNDIENYISGLKADNNYFYITYKQAIGSPPGGQQITWIKIYDDTFNLIDTIKVKSTIWGPGGEEVRPSLDIFEDKIFSGQSMAPVAGTGYARVFVYNFITSKATPPTPVLSAPSNNSTEVLLNPTLSWNSSPGATIYRLQVSTSSNFISTILDDSTITDTSKQIGPLLNNTSYYWRMNAKNLVGTSYWTMPWSFTTLVVQSLPYENSHFGIFGAYAANEYTNFKSRMGFTDNQYWNWVNGHFRNLGTHWTRSNLQLIWDFIEPTLDSIYNWNSQPFQTDKVIINVYDPVNQVHWLGVFHEGGLFGQKSGAQQSLRDPLSDTIRYKRFVQDVVERYDGDGYHDVNPYVKVHYWQIGNEIPIPTTDSNKKKYVEWVKITSRAIHCADSDAKIVLIAQTDGFTLWNWLRNVIIELSTSNFFDAIDIHHWGNKSNYQMPAVRQVRQLLDSLRLYKVQIWSCENGTWAYQPSNPPIYQTQEEQARSLIQRYVYNIGLGLDKLFWNNLMEWFDFNGDQGSIFNSMGLIGDGMRNSEPAQNFNKPRVSYYSYKMLSQLIDADKARYEDKMSIHKEPNLYAYHYISLTKDSTAFYILWKNSGNQTIMFHINSHQALVTNMITDSLGNIRAEYTVNADNQGNVSITVGVDPLSISEISKPTSVQNELSTLKQFELYQNYPNPFNPTTTIRFSIPKREHTTLKIFDVLGKEVVTLVEDEINPGEHSVIFNAQSLASGLYFYHLSTSTFCQTKSMAVMK